MTNEEQVALLKQGSKVWNAWRKENLEIGLDLRYADLISTNLRYTDLRSADLRYTDLRSADLRYTDLRSADLRYTDLRSADLRYTDLSDANLSEANLSSASLSEANLSYANLNYANLQSANLQSANLQSANLQSANLRYANLNYADLQSANLSSANLSSANLNYANLSSAKLRTANLSSANFRTANLSYVDLNGSQVLHANFTQAILTGACIVDWQIGSSTILQHVKCNYVFRTYNDKKQQFSGRLPVDPENTFAPDEFTQLFQVLASALETIPITFTEGIDWQAFFQSFQDLRASRPTEDISIQGMERKGDAFVVRLEVEANVDKAAIETEIKQRYAHQLAILEVQYEERLRLQGAHLEDARRTIELERQRNTEILGVIGIVAQNQGSKYDMRGAQFAGGFAETVHGNQNGGIIHNYGQNADDVVRLLTSLRQLSQAFPEDQKADVLMELDDLESDLSKPDKQEPKRIGKRLQRILAAGTAAATLAGGAATFTGDLNEFTQNVLELGEKIGLDRGTIQGNP